tara:strand:+ start:245 stop:1081 length:837 start_codon:yes stop_codon:yes gene_type:complete
MVSVAMCVYAGDNEKLFFNALDSILSQTMLPDEIILIGDGPLIKPLYDQIDKIRHKINHNTINCHFRYIELDKNYGHGEARRASIENARGDLIAICDADDLNHNKRFEIQSNYLKNNPTISIVGSHVLEKNLLTEDEKYSVRKVPISHNQILKYAPQRCPFNQMTVMFRRKDIISVGSYEDFYCNEDYYLWFKLIKADMNLANIDKILVTAHLDSNSFGRRGGIKYFLSEIKVKKIFLNAGMLSYYSFLYNVVIRFVLQVILPSFIRKFIFKIYLREN